MSAGPRFVGVGGERFVRVEVQIALDGKSELAAHGAEFREARYPELSLELIAREQLGDLVAEGFDVAVRFGQPPSSSLVARKLLETPVVTVASPLYIRKHGRPTTPAELVNHACILVCSPMTGQPLEWQYRSGRKIIPAQASGRLLVSDAGTMLGACLAGTGIARFKASGVLDLLEKGRLIELLPDWAAEIYSLYALYPSRHLPAARVRAFIDFVIELLDADRA